jgi:hypothetical protein
LPARKNTAGRGRSANAEQEGRKAVALELAEATRQTAPPAVVDLTRADEPALVNASCMGGAGAAWAVAALAFFLSKQ